MISAALFVMTLVWPRWVEEIFGVEPDSGSGAFELMIVIGFAVVAAASATDAIVAWRRARFRRLRATERDRLAEG
ncbi:MAG: ABC transporter permease [Actinomycetota bacterium]|nr:ABC transporter permease [Actinomycetota bacterium]